MSVSDLFFQVLLHVLLFFLLNKAYARLSYRSATVLPAKPSSSPFLSPDLECFMVGLKTFFKQRFPNESSSKGKKGRPKLYRLPFFMTWVWNRLYFKQDTNMLLEKVNNDPGLRKMFEIPLSGLKATTYDDFTAKELQDYLRALTKETIRELWNKGIIKMLVLAMDDLPVDSPLSMSKAIDFVGPRPDAVTKVFQTLETLDEVLTIIGSPPNTQRSWNDYIRLYLVYVLWGFPSKESFDKFLRVTPNIETILQLDKKKVLSVTLFKYINKLETMHQAEKIFNELLKTVLALPAVKERLKKNRQVTELGMVHGVLGNDHALKDYGAKLHYNSSKGKYYFGRIARIIVDTWSQLPLWITVTSASQPLAKELETFGKELTTILPPDVKTLLMVADQGFRGTIRMEAMRKGFQTIKTILLTPAYRRVDPSPNIFRKERLAVERTIGHLEVHLDLEHPRQIGTQAAVNWTLGAVFLLQRIALYNHEHQPHRSTTAIRYLQY